MLMYKKHYFEDKILGKKVVYEKLLLKKNLIYRFLVNVQFLVDIIMNESGDVDVW